jgi:hypothetical protein
LQWMAQMHPKALANPEIVDVREFISRALMD